MKILIFDVETTGLLPKIIKNEDIDKYPYIIQLSYILFDKDRNKIEEKFDNYIIIKRQIKKLLKRLRIQKLKGCTKI